MLTADLVIGKRRADNLVVAPLKDPQKRHLALTFARDLLEVIGAHVGTQRHELAQSLKGLAGETQGSDLKMFLGLQKLALDRCEFSTMSAQDAAVARQKVFTAAAQARMNASTETPFSRTAVLQACAHDLGIAPVTLDDSLFADLPGSDTLCAASMGGAEALVDYFEIAQWQAVFLKAVRVQATVKNASPTDYRYLFRRLKFLQLLFEIHPRKDGGYDITIDGPFSLFDAVTRYGLKLAVALPALMKCGTWQISADVRWGKERRQMQFNIKGGPTDAIHASETSGADVSSDSPLGALLARLETNGGPWRVSPSDAVLNIPGQGVCVPDLEFQHADTGRLVYFEMLGFWSRDAVWKRVQWAQSGPPAPVVFGVSEKLRVSESVLQADVPGALYVFKRTPNAAALIKRVEQAAAFERGPP